MMNIPSSIEHSGFQPCGRPFSMTGGEDSLYRVSLLWSNFFAPLMESITASNKKGEWNVLFRKCLHGFLIECRQYGCHHLYTNHSKVPISTVNSPMYASASLKMNRTQNFQVQSVAANLTMKEENCA